MNEIGSAQWPESRYGEIGMAYKEGRYEDAMQSAMAGGWEATLALRSNPSAGVALIRANMYTFAARSAHDGRFTESTQELCYAARGAIMYVRSLRNLSEAQLAMLDLIEEKLAEVRAALTAMGVDTQRNPIQYMKNWLAVFGDEIQP